MSDEPTLKELFDDLRAVQEQRAAEKRARMFLHPTICELCGASVLYQDQHVAFHEMIESFARNVVRAFDQLGRPPRGNNGH